MLRFWKIEDDAREREHDRVHGYPQRCFNQINIELKPEDEDDKAIEDDKAKLEDIMK